MLTIDKDMTIDGAGHSVIISGDKDGSGGANFGDLRVFIIDTGAVANLNNLTITRGYHVASGAGILNLGTLNLTDSTFSNNMIAHDGDGGAGIMNRGTLTVANSTFTGKWHRCRRRRDIQRRRIDCHEQHLLCQQRKPRRRH